MFHLPLEDHLHLIKLATGEDVRLPVPPRCQQLWQRAKDEGWNLRALYVLKAPLSFLAAATFNTETRDCWVLQDAEDERVTIRRLLHELAHAAHTHAPASDLDDDWSEEVAVTELAFQLAQQWNVADAFTAADLEQELAAIEQYREDHWAAARLAGSEDPRLARAAYSALVAQAREARWEEDAFEAALHGWGTTPDVERRILTFDRCSLRASWRLLGREGHGFEEALDLPLDEQGAALLREQLARLSRKGPGPLWLERRPWGEASRDFGWIQLREEADLTPLLAHAQALLLRFPEQSALAVWSLYTGDGQQRLYRLVVGYGSTLPSGELWVLGTPGNRRAQVVEAAWQAFMRGWSRHTTLRQAPCAEGLQELWEALKYSRPQSGRE